MIECLSGPLSPAISHELADLQARAYAPIGIRSWSADEIEGLAASPCIHLLVERGRDGVVRGFLCISLVCDEGEILSLAVDPNHRRRGTASVLLASMNNTPKFGDMSRIVLEVAETNTVALSFYRMLGFVDTSIRRGYYLIEGNRVDARCMECCRFRRDREN